MLSELTSMLDKEKCDISNKTFLWYSAVESRQQTFMFCNSVSGWVDNDTQCALVNAEQFLENRDPFAPSSEKALLSIWCKSALLFRIFKGDALKLNWIETILLFYHSSGNGGKRFVNNYGLRCICFSVTNKMCQYLLRCCSGSKYFDYFYNYFFTCAGCHLTP